MDAGGRIAFGTDGISFSDREDFFQELRLACYLQRMPETFERQRLDSEAVLRAAAVNGAQAVGLQDRLGSLAPGRYADLLILDKERITFPPGRYDLGPFLDVVIDRADAGDIDTVMAHGRVLMQDKRVTILDEQALKERFAEAVQRIYRLPDDVARWLELGRLVEPYVIDFYQRWYGTPVEAAGVYNAKRLPVVG
jgi:5-methylthioadenosine/S-adenosylhomocysteine deaminase